MAIKKRVYRNTFVLNWSIRNFVMNDNADPNMLVDIHVLKTCTKVTPAKHNVHGRFDIGD